ncbi:hypothetical protein DXU77_03490 [Pseudomonas lactis]|uniref:hypothetical protein n=1 Tax=Pseudomonas TaxID=286 RepID=UPI00129804C1|nr:MULTISPECIES: hypothetical protein [Pseudomonas]MQB14185.1 hypothetical protein [Pseudomonas lactis]NCE92669.1 hypothetical protein [Pseudomonas sp. L13]
MSTEYLLNLSVSAQIALSSAGCMLIAVIFDIFLAYRKLEKMEHLLNQCRLVNDYKCLLGNNLQGRLARLCVVYVAIALPKWNAKRRVINVRQVEEFPRYLKLMLHGIAFIGLIGAVGATVFHFRDQLSF